jgi:ABC-type cobalamin/Fe3+-siderophores transport system ATPase subunit/predicted nuclease with TOPRIM domain
MTYSRFHLCDLQVHSPADAHQGYGDVGGPEPNEAFAQRLVEAHAAVGVTVMAITDHNRVDWYPVLRAAGMGIGVTVFPGLEFSVNGCHLLAIWDATDDGYDRARRFLEQLFGPGEARFLPNRQPRPVGRGQVLEHARQVVGHGGLVFAPHATLGGMGVFARGVCSNSGEIARSDLITGFDVYGNKRADVLINPRSEFADVPPRWFISGDTRSLDDIGKRAVYLKLGPTPDLEGIRQAFLVPETRIRFPPGLRDDWTRVKGVQFLETPEPVWPRLTKITVEGGFHDGLAVELAPGLNALIGGRGTGKSALIEIIRHTLEAGQPDEQDLRENLRHTFSANAEATIGFVDQDGTAYEAHRSGGTPPAGLVRSGQTYDVAIGRRLSIRIFGQRQLQALGLQPTMLRQFVASHADKPWADLIAEEQQIVDQLRRIRDELGTLEADLARMDEREAHLADLQERLDRALAYGIEDLLAQSARLEEAIGEVNQAFEWAARGRQVVTSLQDLPPRPPLPDHPDVPAELADVLEAIAAAIQSAGIGLAGRLDELEPALARQREQWERGREGARAQVQQRLAAAGISDPAELAAMQASVVQLQREIASLPETRARLGELAQQRLHSLDQLGKVRRRKSRLVERVARELTKKVKRRVRIAVDPMQDRGLFLGALERAVRGQSVRRDQLARLSREDPRQVAKAIRDGTEALTKLGCSEATAGKLAALPPDIVREFEEVDTPDDLRVEVDLGTPGAENWKPVSAVSPGQRATALLALVLANGVEPLVIDQPEDDLDNRYVYEEIVKLLAEVCQHRQVIVATHNANIPILGDAELVVALDAEADRGMVLAAGGFENPVVAEKARHILEGGDEAFRARQRRYLAVRSQP